MIGAIMTFLAVGIFILNPYASPAELGLSGLVFETSPPQVAAIWAPFASLIWIWICVWLLVSAGYGIWKRAFSEPWNDMRPTLILALAFSAVWQPISLDAPLIGLGILWVIWLLAVTSLFRAPENDRVLAAWPVGLFAGWITVLACMATLSLALRLGLFNAAIFAQVLITVLAGLASGVQLVLRGSPTFGLAAMWALVGIYWTQSISSPAIADMAIAGGVGIAGVTAIAMVRDWRRLPN